MPLEMELAMTDMSVIILPRDERLHTRRCLERLLPLDAGAVYVVDCLSEDGTREIVESYANRGVRYVPHVWPGNQAEQFHWALDNLKIETEWILRLDADEYLTPELVVELKEKLLLWLTL